jgi:hypothetical protein
MTYFGRLAQRVGPAMPRAPVTPAARPVAPNAGGGADAGGLESFAEVPVSGTPAAIAPATTDPPSASGLAVSAPTEAAASESRRHLHEDRIVPAAHEIARAVAPSTQREWVALDSAVPPQGALPDRPSAAPGISREAIHEVSTEVVTQTPASDVARSRGRAESAPRARSPQAAASVQGIATLESQIEPPLRAESKSLANRSRVDGDLAAAAMPARSRPPQIRPETDDIAVPGRRIVPAAVRDRDARQPDRATPAASRAPATQKARENSVEVRIGAVTLQVHAPPAPAAPQAPARGSFAPHRHYLRTW